MMNYQEWYISSTAHARMRLRQEVSTLTLKRLGGVDATPPLRFFDRTAQTDCTITTKNLATVLTHFPQFYFLRNANRCVTFCSKITRSRVQGGGGRHPPLCEHTSKQIFRVFLAPKFFLGVTYVCERHMLHIKILKSQKYFSFFFLRKLNKIIILYSIFRKKSKTHAIPTIYQIVGNDQTNTVIPFPNIQLHVRPIARGGWHPPPPQVLVSVNLPSAFEG